MNPAAKLAEVRTALEAVGQGHLLTFYPSLSPDAQDALLKQVADLDLGAVPGLIREYVKNKPDASVPAGVGPAPYYGSDGLRSGQRWDAAAYAAKGEALIRAGKIAAFTVAGGQGSRLGFEGPKGCFPAGAVTNKPLFHMFADGLLATERRYGRVIPWYIMTSPLNHEATVRFFETSGFFGLARQNVMFFPQGVLPSFDMSSGRILLAGQGEIATNPDGHGGSFKALGVSGAVDDMKRRGIEHVSYFQVDNPMVRVVDPVFIGLHAAAPDSSGEMSSKMIPKAYPEEKLGVFCASNGRVMIVEYSDLPEQLSKERLPDGGLRFIAGSIAVHIISVEFIERINTSASFSLPYHRAEKKIPFVDVSTGEIIKPETNNGVKLERFVFDALPMCRSSIVYQTDRAEEFAPIKNAAGVDSAESSRALQAARSARWLAEAGIAVPKNASGEPGAIVEISPLTALDPQELRSRNLKLTIAKGARLAI